MSDARRGVAGGGAQGFRFATVIHTELLAVLAVEASLDPRLLSEPDDVAVEVSEPVGLEGRWAGTMAAAMRGV